MTAKNWQVKPRTKQRVSKSRHQRVQPASVVVCRVAPQMHVHTGGASVTINHITTFKLVHLTITKSLIASHMPPSSPQIQIERIGVPSALYDVIRSSQRLRNAEHTNELLTEYSINILNEYSILISLSSDYKALFICLSI